jgi:hypothetical protein
VCVDVLSPESSTVPQVERIGQEVINSVLDGMCPGRDSKWDLPAYESEALPVFSKSRRTRFECCLRPWFRHVKALAARARVSAIAVVTRSISVSYES